MEPWRSWSDSLESFLDASTWPWESFNTLIILPLGLKLLYLIFFMVFLFYLVNFTKKFTPVGYGAAIDLVTLLLFSLLSDFPSLPFSYVLNLLFYSTSIFVGYDLPSFPTKFYISWAHSSTILCPTLIFGRVWFIIVKNSSPWSFTSN